MFLSEWIGLLSNYHNKEDLVAEEEWKKWEEAWLCERWTTGQMAQAAHAESSKQVTWEFA